MADEAQSMMDCPHCDGVGYRVSDRSGNTLGDVAAAALKEARDARDVERALVREP